MAGLPILAISAASEQEAKEQALEAGMNDFVLKPFNPEELYNRLVFHLQKSTASLQALSSI